MITNTLASTTFTLLLLTITNIIDIIASIKHLTNGKCLTQQEGQDGAFPRGSAGSPPRLVSGCVSS